MKGSMTALITPFKDGKLDKNTYEKLIKRQIENGIDVVVPMGTTGESATLSHTEHKECIEIAIGAVKGTKAKVLAGAGSNATHESIDLAKFAQKLGADGILCVTPYYNKPTQEGLYQHYKSIANAVDLEVVVYNVPGRTGVDLLPDTMIRLFDDVKNINTIKEATGSLERVVNIASKREKIDILSGEDAINYPIIASGGAGCISVTANLLPKEISDLVRFGLNAEHKKANDLSLFLYDINNILFVETNPLPIKYAMFKAGIIEHLEYKLPLVAPSLESCKKIDAVLKKYL